MNHAFLMLVHAHPILFRKIIYSLAADNHYFFINIDKKTDEAPFKENVKDIKNVFFLNGANRKTVNHGCFSMIDCTLKLLKIASNHTPQIDYFHLLSGQDYLCMPQHEFDSFFADKAPISFMMYDTEEQVREWRKNKYRTRMQSWYLGDIFPSKNIIVRSIKKSCQIICNILIKRPNQENIYAGWQWFSWHRNVVNFILNFLQENPKYAKRFHYTHCGDELFFHTILYNHLEELNIEPHNSLRFIEWHPKRPYKTLPLVLEETEYDEIIKSRSIFCRKIHPDTSKVLIQKLNNIIYSIKSEPAQNN